MLFCDAWRGLRTVVFRSVCALETIRVVLDFSLEARIFVIALLKKLVIVRQAHR